MSLGSRRSSPPPATTALGGSLGGASAPRSAVTSHAPGTPAAVVASGGPRGPAPGADFELIARHPTDLVAVAGDCIIVVIDRTLSVNGVLAIARGFERLQQAYGRFGYLSVVEPSRLGAMDPPARALMAQLVGKHSPHVIAASFAVLGTGFRATAVRSVLTAIHLASGARHPMKAFASLGAALAWYVEQHPTSRRDTATLAEVVRLLGSP